MAAPTTQTAKKEIRKFGGVAWVFFGCLCGFGIWRNKPAPILLFGLLSLLGLGLVLLPKQLKPVYQWWMKLAHLVGKALTVAMLTLAYYLVVTPTALLRRLLVGPPIPLKPDKNASTYWVTRTEPVQPKERFIKRY